MKKINFFGKAFEDFKIGETFSHPVKKTITESDNNLFCLLTINHHPVHIDNEYAKVSDHGKILVVGTYVFSLVVGMSVVDISGAAIANLEYEYILHHKPVFIGDTIRSESTILDKKLSKTKSDRGVIYLETRAFNQNKKKILSFRRKVLIPNYNYVMKIGEKNG